MLAKERLNILRDKKGQKVNLPGFDNALLVLGVHLKSTQKIKMSKTEI